MVLHPEAEGSVRQAFTVVMSLVRLETEPSCAGMEEAALKLNLHFSFTQNFVLFVPYYNHSIQNAYFHRMCINGNRKVFYVCVFNFNFKNFRILLNRVAWIFNI